MKIKIISLTLSLIIMISFAACKKDEYEAEGNTAENPYNIKYMSLKKELSNEKDSNLTEGNCSFAFDIFKELIKTDVNENVFISPYSISAALSMVYNGAEGATKEGMAETLNYTGITDQVLNNAHKYLMERIENADKKVEIDINNSIWIRENEKINQGFIDINKKVFDAYVAELDFSKEEAADVINNWIDNATKGMITKMVDSPIDPSTVMFLINTIYFKGTWTEEFDPEKTYDSVFNNQDGTTSDVKMMSKDENVYYGQGNDFKVVRLPYGNEDTSMYVIMPDEAVDINNFISNLNSDKFKEITGSIAKEEKVQLRIPKFKVEYGIRTLNDELTALGMGDAFSAAADFSGIREGIFISRVLHKAVIEVDEAGTKAAGVTVVEMKELAIKDPLSFIANRPFIYIIADDEDQSILFMGKMSGF